MKSSAIALMTAAALMFGANAVSYAQDAATTTTTPTAEECADLGDAGTSENGESLVSDQEEDSDDETATGSESSSGDASTAVDDRTLDCPPVATDGAAAAPAASGDAAATDAAATTALTPEECLALQGAGATPPNESLVSEQENDSDNQTSLGTESDSSDATGAIDDENPEGCADVTETNDE
ncbi:MAG TPA: hypothetical protein VGB81_15025 [Devosia sp.]